MPPLIYQQPQFALLDLLRRAQGQALGSLGFGPAERGYRVLAGGGHWRLRDYGGSDGKPPLLIVAAPIKRPYIWDLAPAVSAIRYCLDHDLHVYLIEWIPSEQAAGDVGLDECVDAISGCVAIVTNRSPRMKPFLVGHSLGGTLAVVFGAYDPRVVAGLLLLGAPLCFQAGTSSFRDALVAIIPSDLTESGLVPGSLLSHASALASPQTFVWSRLIDATMSISDPRALDIHARVERWALDEAPLPGKLVHQIVDWLYRENRFCRGALTVLNRAIGPSCLDLPMLAVVNTADEVAPLASIEPLFKAVPTRDVSVIRYAGETGVALQHLGILVGREAYARVWPSILTWLAAHH
jgi:polyhydroxyalkanoate synthase subunit PhaC